MADLCPRRASLSGVTYDVGELTVDQRAAVRDSAQCHQRRLVPVFVARIVVFELVSDLVGAGDGHDAVIKLGTSSSAAAPADLVISVRR